MIPDYYYKTALYCTDPPSLMVKIRTRSLYRKISNFPSLVFSDLEVSHHRDKNTDSIIWTNFFNDPFSIPLKF